MKTVLKPNKLSWFVIFCLAVVLAVLVCNAWQLCCGHCVLADYLQIPVIGWVLIGANLVAGLILLLLRRRKAEVADVNCCHSCQNGSRASWIFCPNCGSALQP